MPRLLIIFLIFSTSCLQGQVGALLDEALVAPAARQAEIARELQAFPLADFGTSAATMIGQILNQGATGGRKDFILLLGFLGAQDRLLALNGLPEFRSYAQSINLALVRAGNTGKEENLLKNIKRYPVNDDFNYTVVPLLTYTRKRKVIDFLWQQVVSENKNCQPADAETKGRIDCAYRIVESLAPIIVDFPVGVDEEGNLLTADYSKGLTEIRRWYAVHSQDYRIITNTF